MDTKWLKWARALQAIAQTGIHYANHPSDLGRYKQVQQIAAEIIADGASDNVERISGILDGMSGYATPQVAVRGGVFRDEKILLVKQRKNGRWALPGGYAEVNESPSENIVREIREETGFVTEVVKLVGVYDNQNPPVFHRYGLFFQCEIVGGVATPSEETEDVVFFRENEISRLDTIGETARQVSQFYNHYRNPDLPTELG